MENSCLHTALLLLVILGYAVSNTLPNENLLFWSVADNNECQIRWLPSDPRSYKDNATITTVARYTGNYRWNAIAVDYFEQNAIMSDSMSNSIFHAREWFHIEGDAVPTVFGTSGYLVHAIGIDWFSRSFYWIDEGFNWIRLSSYESVKTTLIIGSGIEKPQGIAVYPLKGYIFWTDSAKRHIERASLVGKNRTIIIENIKKIPKDIVVDTTVDGGRVLWIEETNIYNDNHTVLSSDFDGSDLREEYTMLFQDGTLQQIAVDEEFIFIAIQILNGVSIIRHLSKTSKVVFYDLEGLEGEILDIVLSNPAIQPFTASSCIDPKYNTCDEFCVHNSELFGYDCLCSDKLTLEADGSNCTFDNSVIQPPYLMFTRQNEISFIPVTLVHQGQAVSDGIDTIHTFLGDSEMPLALTIDFHEKRLFYSDQVDRSIKVVEIVVGKLPEVIFQRIGYVEDMAVDWLAKNIYWTDSEYNHLVVCSYDSRYMKELFNIDVRKPRNIAVDPFEKLLFWSELGPPGQIESSNLDGSDRRILTSNVLIANDQPSGLALDLDKRRIYFGNRVDGTINYVNYDGSNFNTLLHEAEYLNFFDFTLYQDFIMWTESGGRRNGIYTIYNENEAGIDGSLMDNTSTIYAIETYDETVQPIGTSLCDQVNNGGCSQLCLTSILNETSCSCSDGFTVDISNHRNCVPALSLFQDNFFLIADQEKHIIFQMNAIEPFEYVGLNFGQVGNPVSISYDPIERRLYWIDADALVIKRSSLDGTNVETIIKDDTDQRLVSPKGLSVDYVTRLIFWTDSILKNIEVSLLDGTARYNLISTENEEPQDIVTDPIGRRIFWTIQGNNPSIRTAYMDGGSQRVLQTSQSISKPSGIVIDFEDNRLYWCDENSGIIESITLEGTDPITYLEEDSSAQPSSITLMLNDVIWSDNFETSLRHIDRGTGEAVYVDGNHFGMISSIHHHASISILQVSDAGENGCLEKNGGCSKICLPGRVVGQVTCKCHNDHCDADTVCSKTFLGGGVFDNCTRTINSSCGIYCIPGFNINNVTSSITCNVSGVWDQDTESLCIRIPDPDWIYTTAIPTTSTSFRKSSPDRTLLWIIIGSVGCVVMLIVVIIVVSLCVRRNEEKITSSQDTEQKLGFDISKRPLPDPNDDIYDDPDYSTVEELGRRKKNPSYDRQIIKTTREEEDTEENTKTEKTPYYLTVVDNSNKHIDKVDDYRTHANASFVDDYATNVDTNFKNGHKSNITETPYYLTVINDDADNINTNSVFVNDYITRHSVDTKK